MSGLTICMYGAASNRIDPKYVDAVEAFGREIALKGYRLIYGGGSSGLMGACARGVISEGGTVIGVTPHFLHVMEPVFEECTETIRTESMAMRKQVMEENADAFVIVPGGIGTYDEFFQTLTLKDLGRHHKPIVLYNIDGYFQPTIDLIRTGIEEGFINGHVALAFSVANSLEDVFRQIEEEIAQASETEETEA